MKSWFVGSVRKPPRLLRLLPHVESVAGIHLHSISQLERLDARFELRVESFNVLNHMNWGDPVANFNSGQFGRITTLATGSAPRILQFGIKYDF